MSTSGHRRACRLVQWALVPAFLVSGLGHATIEGTRSVSARLPHATGPKTDFITGPFWQWRVA